LREIVAEQQSSLLSVETLGLSRSHHAVPLWSVPRQRCVRGKTPFVDVGQLCFGGLRASCAANDA
jgi:hypothetical protein